MSPGFFKPKQSVNRMPQDTMIGEMLVKAQIISQKQLDECIRLAGNKRLHLGQMLIMHGYINTRDLQAAVDAQTMMRDNLVEQDFAIKCLKMACKQGLSFQEVCGEQQAIVDQREVAGQATFGHLLLEADVVPQHELEAAYAKSSATGIPMGRILVLNGEISEQLLAKALDLQVRIRDGLVVKEEAVEALRVAAGLAQPTPMTQAILAPPKDHNVRLGQLMLMAKIMSEADVLNAIELGLTYNILIGQVMVEQGYVSVQLVEAALELQEHVRIQHVDAERAAHVLYQVYQGAGSVNDLITSLQPVLKMDEVKPKVSFEKLLVLSRVVSQEQVQEAFDICRQTPEALAKILCLTGFITGDIHDAVLRCHELLDQGRLNQDDALVALDYTFSKGAGANFDDALTDLGWSENNLMQSELAQLEHDQSFDPERTADEIPVVGSDAVPGFNLLEHFGLSQQEGGDDTDATVPDVEEETAAEPAVAAEESWVMPEDSGEGPSFSSMNGGMGVETTDTPVISISERILDHIPDPADRIAAEKPPAENERRLANILDRLADDDEEPEAHDESSNGSSKAAASGNGQGGALESAKVVSPPSPGSAEAKALGPLGRVRPDREALRQQEMTIAPQRLKMDESAMLTKKDEEPAEQETDKKAAVGAAMYRLAESYFDQGDFPEAQKIYEKILAIRQAELGPQHVELVDDLNKLAEVLWVQGNFRQAEPFMKRAVTILEQAQPVDTLKLAEGLRILAGLYFQQGKYDPCLPLLEGALLMKQSQLGEDHKDVGNLLREYAKLLKKMGRKDEAEKFLLKAKKILG